MIARAIERNIHVSAKKAKLVCRLIRNKSVSEAVRILQNQPQKAAKHLYKLVLSASSNAVNNHAMSGKDLYVFNSVANQAKIMKRTLPRAKGRADIIRKRYSHLEVWVSDDLNEGKKRNLILLKPRAHQSKYRKALDERGPIEIMPKIIAKKQQSSEDKK